MIKDNLYFLKSKPIIHKCLYNNRYRENSRDSLICSLKTGYTIEIDLRLVDHEIIVFHDDNLKRLYGIDKDIYKILKKDIIDYNILTFRELIDLNKDKSPLLIEIKDCDNYLLLLNKLTSILDNYEGLFAIQSFNPKIIYWLCKNRSNYIKGLLISNKKNIYNTKIIYKVYRYMCRCDFYTCNYKLYNKIDKYKKNMIVLGYTINNYDDYIKYSKYFDNLVCDNLEEYYK